MDQSTRRKPGPKPVDVSKAPKLGYRIDELAAAWGVSRMAIVGLLDDGELVSFYVGRARVITAASADDYERRHTVPTKAEGRPA